jgi:predicted NACHT family NTPase
MRPRSLSKAIIDIESSISLIFPYMSQQVYNWKRFWCPRSSQVDLGDRGFLTNPESDWGKHVNPNLVALEVIADIPCLVLLGEPGIGKSKTIKMEQKRISESDGKKLLNLDLRAFGSEDRLVKRLFESSQFTDWVQGNHTLHIFLDSLDECLLRIDNVTALLAEEFKQYQDKAEHLFLRITCRTAVWQFSFEEQLKHIWGEDQVRIYELAPLRQNDVKDAAKLEGIDNPDVFLQEVWNKKIVPLAIKPITLGFLFDIYRCHGQFSENQTLYDLYREGCRMLCDEEEDSDPRRPGRNGNLELDQRLIVAARIAAVTVFANRDAIWRRNRGQVPDEDVLCQELQGYERVNGNRFEVSEAAIREVLDTGLFSSRGLNRIGWAHQTYAEFLAAWYLKQHKLNLSQILSLIIHPDQKLIPQLQETAAWLADMMPEVFQEVMKTDPDILLQIDLENKSDDQKKALVSSLLKAHGDGILPRRYNFRRYTKLSHSTLAKQLHPYVCGHTGNENAQRVAIDIAGACRLKELQNDLVNVALNPQELYWTRVSAAVSVCQIGDAVTKAKLMPLALSQAGDDPEDELKGCGPA